MIWVAEEPKAFAYMMAYGAKYNVGAWCDKCSGVKKSIMLSVKCDSWPNVRVWLCKSLKI